MLSLKQQSRSWDREGVEIFLPLSDETETGWQRPSWEDTTGLPFCNLSKKASEDTKLAGVQWKRHFLTVCGRKTEQPVKWTNKGQATGKMKAIITWLTLLFIYAFSFISGGE